MSQVDRAIRPTKREIILATVEIVESRRSAERQRLEGLRHQLYLEVIELQKAVKETMNDDSILPVQARRKLSRLRESGAKVEKSFSQDADTLTVRVTLNQTIEVKLPTPAAIVESCNKIGELERERSKLYKLMEALNNYGSDPIARIIKQLPAEYLPHLEKLADGISEILSAR